MSRARTVDAGFILFALTVVAAFAVAMARGGASSDVLAVNVTAGLAACVLLWWRRQHPAVVVFALAPLAAVSLLSTGAVLVAWFTVAVHRRWPVLVAAGALYLAVLPVHLWRRSVGTLGLETFLPGLAVTACAVAWGVVLRHLRSRSEADELARVRQAQHLERTRIAREMHDVLAHRMSLLSLHAGALEFRPDAPPAEIERAAGVIRESAFQALEELREIIGLLRADETGEPGVAATSEPARRPQPVLADLPALVDECREAGLPVRLTSRLADPSAVPGTAGRDAYRIVQEGLTNARKHAPGAKVEVAVEGDEQGGLRVEVTSGPAGAAQLAHAVPGSGTGLIGLAERAKLAGGWIEHEPVADGGFRLRAWLPWRR